MMIVYPVLTNLHDFLGVHNWPLDFIDGTDIEGFLRKTYIQDHYARKTQDGLEIWMQLVLTGEAAFKLPGLSGVKFVVGGNLVGFTFITLLISIGQETSLTLENLRFSLRFDPEILKPAPTSDQSLPAEFVEI